MSDKVRQREMFIEKRARALAMILLTSRDDLLVEEVTDDIGLDYVVRFHADSGEGLRELGIQVRGVWTAPTKDDADKVLRVAMQQRKRYGPFLRPVCLFVFAMANDQAWYTWLAEPVAAADGQTVLRSGDEPDCQPLDRRTFNDILDRVDGWYEAIFPRLIVNGPGESRAGRKRTKP